MPRHFEFFFGAKKRYLYPTTVVKLNALVVRVEYYAASGTECGVICSIF